MEQNKKLKNKSPPYSQLIFNKVPIYFNKGKVFSTNGAGKTGLSAQKREKLYPLLIYLFKN